MRIWPSASTWNSGLLFSSKYHLTSIKINVINDFKIGTHTKKSKHSLSSIKLLWSRSLPYKTVVIGIVSTNLTSIIKAESLLLRRALLQACRYLRRMQRGLHSPAAELCAPFARQRKDVATHRRVPSCSARWDKVLTNARGKRLVDGLQLTSRQALDLTLVQGGAQIWGCPCSSAGVKKETQILQNQGRNPSCLFSHRTEVPILLSCMVLSYLGEGSPALFSPGGSKPFPTSPEKLTLP